MAFIITRSIVGLLQNAVTVGEAVAEGDLTSKVVATGSDEVSQLLRALHHMNDSLVDIVSHVRNRPDSIATGSSRIAVGDADLSPRTVEQNSKLQQTDASKGESWAPAFRRSRPVRGWSTKRARL